MMHPHAADERWQHIVTARAEEVSLAEGALLIAAGEYRDLDVARYLDRIDEMGATLRRRLRSDISTTDALIALNHYVFEDLGFRGNTDDYYDPRNSFLNDVIDRKLGIPITLSVLYIEIGRRIGLPLHGVSFPAHFLVKCVLREGAIILDPYARGASLGMHDLQERLKGIVADAELPSELLTSMLTATGPKEIFVRILRNLRAIYMTKGDRLKALSTCDRIIVLLPEEPAEYRDRGELYLELECFRAALADFKDYLRLNPLAEDQGLVKRRIAELEPLAARLN